MKETNSKTISFNKKRLLVLTLLAVSIIIMVKNSPLLSLDNVRPSHDWSDIHQTDAMHAIMAVQDGSFLPFWSPYLQSGTALFPAPTKPFTYPLFLPTVLILGPYLGMNLLTLFHILIGALGMAVLSLRLRCGYLAAAVSGVLFAFTSYPGSLLLSQPFWGYAVALWPYTIICLLNILDHRKPVFFGFIMGCLLSMQIHSGGIFPFYWICCFMVAYSIPYLLKKHKWSDFLASISVIVLIFLGLSAIKLLPALEWMKTTGRGEPLTHEEIFFGYNELNKHDQGHPVLTILYTLFVHKKTSLVSLGVCVLLGLVFSLKKRKTLAALAGVIFCLVFVTGAAHDFFYDYLPGYNRMRMPYRFCFPAGLGLIMVAGFGVDALWRWVNRSLSSVLVKFPLSLFLMLCVLAGSDALPFIRFNSREFVSAEERREIAKPVFQKVVDDPRPGRIHYPLSRDQFSWIPLGLESTTGAVGGGGSTNNAYGGWLPFETIKDKDRMEETSPGILDVLNTRYIASFKPSKNPKLLPVYQAEFLKLSNLKNYTDAFVARVASDGSTLNYSGYIGGDNNDVGYGIAVDAQARAYVVGHTASTEETFPFVNGADKTHNNGSDIFIGLINPEGSGFESCSYLNHNGLDWGLDIERKNKGVVYMTDKTHSKFEFHKDPFKVKSKSSPLKSIALNFIKNIGQAHEDVFYYIQSGNKAVFLTAGGITCLAPVKKSVCSIKLDFLGSNTNVKPEGKVLRKAKCNFFRGARREWKVNAPSYGKVWYKDLWPGVDMVVIAEKDRLKSRFFIKPGADPSSIDLACRGANKIEISKKGALVITTPAVQLVDKPPLAYQIVNSEKLKVPVFYKLRDKERGNKTASFGFSVEAYDSTRPLVIDPCVLLFSGSIGKTFNGMGKAVAMDKGKGVYVVGQTFSSYPQYSKKSGQLRGGLKTNSDVFAAKVMADTGELIYWSVLSGDAGDCGQGAAVDEKGHLYITGVTRSDEKSFPVLCGPDLVFNGKEDAFVAKLSPGGETLVFCGYVGGAESDQGRGIAVDRAGSAYLSGDTRSDENAFPVVIGPDLTFNGRADGFVAKVAGDGSRLDYCGYVGGKGFDISYSIALDHQDRAYITGVTRSDEKSFPVRKGPDLTFCRSPYRNYLLQYAGKTGKQRFRQIKPFLRPSIYLRSTCLERASVLMDPILVVGKENKRTETIKKAINNPDFNAHEQVFIEKDWPCPGDETLFSSVVFTGSGLKDPDVVAWSEKGKQGRMVTSPSVGVMWKRNGPGQETSSKVQGLSGERIKRKMGRITIDLQGIEGAFLLLSEVLTLHPGWCGEVDGEPVDLLRADGIITAIKLPLAAKKAEFYYTPPYFKIGALITGITAILLITAWFVLRKNIMSSWKNSKKTKSEWTVDLY